MGRAQPGPEIIKLFFMLNLAEHEIFAPNKYENAKQQFAFPIYKQRKFNALLCLARKKLALLVI